MRLTGILLLAGCLQVCARGKAQTVTYSAKQIPLTQVFAVIEKQTGYNFFYDREYLKSIAPVTVQLRETPLQTALETILANQPVSFNIQGNTIVIVKKELPPALTLTEEQVPVDIHGRVLDSTGLPLEGATIVIKGTKIGTHTDSHGNFILRNVSNDALLVFSFTGYESRIMHAKDGPGFVVTLRQKATPLDEQVVQAYGTTTKRFNVGSISKVTADDIASQPVTNPLAALEGRVPGLLVTTNNGNPGASYSVQIRGQNTVKTAANLPATFDNPLFIIDGVPFAPQNNSSIHLHTIDDLGSVNLTSGSSGLSPFNSINPSDIESIEVLKDADATAIYGSRGANGVILITTKKGKSGKTTLNGNLYTGVNHITKIMPQLNTKQYLQYRREAFASDGLTPNTSGAFLPGYAPDLLIFDTTRNDEFVNSFFGRNAVNTSGNLSLSGGNNMNNFYIGAGYNRQGYVFPGDFTDDRVSANITFHHNSADRKLNVEISTQYSYDHNTVPGSPSALTTFSLPPDMPSLRNPDGSLLWTYQGVPMHTVLGTFINPLAYLNLSNNAQIYSLNSNMVLGYQLFPGMTAKVSLGYGSFTSNEYLKNPTTAQDPTYNNLVASATASNSLSYSWIIEPQLNYTHSLGRGRLDVLVGNTEQQLGSTNLTVIGSGFANDLLLNSISGAKTVTSTQTPTLYKYSGSFGRVNYVYNNEYILDLTGRIDGSSRFIAGRQWGKFGAVGAGWIFTEESLLKNSLPFLSFGKIRGSYGATGNDNVGDYKYVTTWQSIGGASVYAGSTGYYPTNLSNPNYSWSVTKKLEGALETGWLNNRLLFNAAWYRNRSGNQLIQYSLPTQTGFSSVTRNFQALVQNTGWEFTLVSNNIKKKDLSWTTTFTLSFDRNKLIAFPGLATSPYANYYVLGRSITTLTGFKYAGINDTTGVFQYYTKKGAITSAPSSANNDNKFAMGTPEPKYYGGLRNTFSYKGFGLDLFIEFRKQTGYNYLSSMTSPFGNIGNVPVEALNYWKGPGSHAQLQKLTTLNYGNPAATAWTDFFQSSGVYGDASFIRFKTLALSYSISSALLKKANMSGCKFFVSAQNLFTITKYRGNDPENQSYYSTPPIRTIAGGLQFNF